VWGGYFRSGESQWQNHKLTNLAMARGETTNSQIWRWGSVTPPTHKPGDEARDFTLAEEQPITHHAELTVTPPAEPARSAAAERMRRHRERRRKGLRCLVIELFEREIDMLVRMELLRAEMRNDATAITEALYAHFDRTLP
jgi:hypothetical protein